jgi:hypothetical protein
LNVFFLSGLIAIGAFGGIRAPGKYNGVVIFDRWDGCHLYGGAYVMEISEKVKESLRPFAGQAILIDAQEVFQPINPGDGLITKLQVLGPAVEPAADVFGRPPMLEGLSLRIIPNFGAQNGDELIIELRNTGDKAREIDTAALAPTLLSKKQGLECLEPSDGPSYAAITRTNIDFMHSHSAGGSCLVDGKGRTVKMWLLSGAAISPRFDLGPGQSIEVPLRFELSAGEYQFLAGYGGGVHAARALASDLLSFDVDEAGKPHFIGSVITPEPARPSQRLGAVCGTVVLEDGTAAASAKVFLWPAPLAKSEPRAANTAVTNGNGAFRMESVLEGNYALSAVRIARHSVLTGASGNRHLADAEVLPLPSVSEDCSLRLTIRPVPTYSVRGRTQAADPASGTRTARLILKRGDAFPFESTAVIQANGQYEFCDVPPGWYQFYAGSTGAGFDVTGDIDDLKVHILWPDSNIGQGARNMELPREFREVMVVATLQGLKTAQDDYADRYRIGFAANFKMLGPPPSWSVPSPEHAGLIGVAGSMPLEDETHISKDGYRITYIPGAAGDGKITSYVLSARPIEFGKSATKSFLMDERGVIHVTAEDRAATTDDTVQKGE